MPANEICVLVIFFVGFAAFFFYALRLERIRTMAYKKFVDSTVDALEYIRLELNDLNQNFLCIRHDMSNMTLALIHLDDNVRLIVKESCETLENFELEDF